MNVAFDPWIPVVTNTGRRELASLAEVLTEGGNFADLAVRPHERVSLMRLFLCVAHAAINGPKDYDEWCEVPQRLPDAASKYLQKWKDSFELFHSEKPWLQVSELNVVPKGKGRESDEAKEWTSLARLDFTRASGHNATLFDHQSNRGEEHQWEEHDIPLALLAFQNFFVAGGQAPSRKWGKHLMQKPPYPQGGPCAGKSIVYAFVRAKTLSDSVWLNLSSYDDLKLLYGRGKEWWGNPLWEKPIKSPVDTEAIKNATQTHVGRLVPQTRILKVGDDRRTVLLGAGFVYPKFQDKDSPFHADPFATIVLTRAGERELLSAKPNIGLWRQLHALIVRQKDGMSSARGPLCLRNVNHDRRFDIVVSSMLTNPKQAAEILDLFESIFHIPSQLLLPEGTVSYEQEVAKAVSLSGRLSSAVSEYRKDLDDNWLSKIKEFEKKTAQKTEVEKARGKKYLESTSPLYGTASSHYWTTVEKKLPLLMAHIEAIDSEDSISTREIWRKMLSMAACDAYSTTCGQETPRQMRAFAKGWQILTGKKDQTEFDKSKKEEVNV